MSRKIVSIFILVLMGCFELMAIDEGVPRIVINPKGHSGKIHNINYTPDGERIISVSEDKSIRVWDAVTGELIKQFYCQIGEGPEGMLYTSAISPDGKYLAVGGYPVSGLEKNYIVLIDLETEKQFAFAEGHTNVINDLCFSHDGKYLASGGDDGLTIIWKVDARNALIEMSTIPHDHRVKAVSFSPKTMDLLVAIEDKDFRLYNLSSISSSKNEYPYKAITRHKENINDVKFSPDGRYFASADENKTVILWSNQGQFLKEINDFTNNVNTMTFSHDSRVLVTLNDVDGIGYSFSIPEMNKFTTFNHHGNTAGSSDFNPKSVEGNYLVASSGGNNNEILVWNAINGKEIRKIKGVGNVVWDLKYLNKDELIISKTKPGSKGYGKKEVLFDFESFQARDVEKQIDFDKENKNIKGFQLKDLYSVEIGGNKTIYNDPNVDGRILSMTKTPSNKIIVGSDFSLKMYNEDGELLKEMVGHTGSVRAVALSPDEKYVATGSDDQTIKIWRLDAKGYVPSMWEVYDNEDYHEFFTAYGLDSLTKVKNKDAWQITIEFLADAKEKVYKDFQHDLLILGEQVDPAATLFIAEDNEWICYTPEGYFSCSSMGADYFIWEVNRGFDQLSDYYSAEQYFDILYRPDILQEIIPTGKTASTLLKEKGERVFDLTKLDRPSAGLFSKPILASGNTRGLEVKRRSYSTENKRIRLNVDIYDGGGGVKEINIYQNNKLILVDDNVKMYNQDHIARYYDVDLLNGENDFKLVVTNYQKIESRPDHQIIEYVGELIATSDLYVFAIGINEYKNNSYNLNYAQPDAKSFTTTLMSKSKRMFKDVHMYELYDADATKESILSTFQKINEQAQPHDVFVLYYAGHGSIDTEDPNAEYYFVPHEVTKIYGDTQLLDEKGISSSELKNLLSEVKSQKQLILLDACHSGGAVKTFMTRSAASEEKAIFQLARSAGVVLIAASGTQQFATEFEELKHGVFTYALLEALEGKGDIGADKKVTVNEVKAYMEDRVPELSQKYGGKTQYPTGFSNGQDFPISLVND